MSPAERYRFAVEHVRHGLLELAEVEKSMPDQVRQAVEAVVAHVRAWRPEVLSPFLQAAPEEPTPP